MSGQSLAVYVRAGVHFECGQRMQNLGVVPGAMEACPTCKRLWGAADRIDQLETVIRRCDEALRAVQTDRPTAHSDRVWVMVGDARGQIKWAGGSS